MTDHRHPRCITPAAGSPHPGSDAEMIQQLNQQLLSVNTALELERNRNAALRREVEELHNFIASGERRKE